MWVCRRKGRKMLTSFEIGHFLKKFINFCGHGVLSGDDGELIGGEFRYNLFDAVHIGLGTSRISYRTHAHTHTRTRTRTHNIDADNNKM